MKNVFSVSLSVGITTLISFLAQLMLARYFSAEDYGKIAFIWTALFILLPISTIGLPQFFLYKLSTESSSAIQSGTIKPRNIYIFGLGIAIAILIMANFIGDIDAYLSIASVPILISISFLSSFYFYYIYTKDFKGLFILPIIQVALRMLAILIVICVFTEFK